ncbi:MAG TPA: hypothetical protein VED20_09840 [Streptosporangiaceae bacterium]|nr:hypothetical protein [Streptosporangiaceae bacterium]
MPTASPPEPHSRCPGRSRIVHLPRTAVITDEVIAEEQPDHTLTGLRGDWTQTP